MAEEQITPAQRLVEALLNDSAPVGWREAVEGTQSQTLGEAITELDALIQSAARLRGYLDGRYGSGCGDQGHKEAVKSANQLVKATRKALGYTYPERGEVSF